MLQLFMYEETMCLLKPDLMMRKLDKEVVTEIEKHFVIKKSKIIKLSEELATQFYAEHQGKVFFKDMLYYITRSEVLALILTGDNAIFKFRELIGNTDPAKATEGTLRAKYGISIDENSFHGSDSMLNAQREIDLIFND